MRVYLDWNATTPPRTEVTHAMADAARSAWANPSSVHTEGRLARSRVEGAREAVALLAKCDPRDVVLTSGGTEANNLALRSAFARAGGTLVVSRIEHPSVTRVAEALEREGRATVHWWRATSSGVVDVEELAAVLGGGGVRLVALQAANHETGVVQPVAEVLAACQRAGALVHVDAVQTLGRSVDVAEYADSRSLAATRWGGPKASGRSSRARVSRSTRSCSEAARSAASARGRPIPSLLRASRWPRAMPWTPPGDGEPSARCATSSKRASSPSIEERA